MVMKAYKPTEHNFNIGSDNTNPANKIKDKRYVSLPFVVTYSVMANKKMNQESETIFFHTKGRIHNTI